MNIDSIYHRFLKAKHWKLFTFSFGLPLVVAIIGMTAVFLMFFTGGGTVQTRNPLLDEGFYIVFGVILLFSFIGSLVFAGWIISVGFGLRKYISEELRLKTGLFKASLIAYVIFVLLTILFIIFIIVVPSKSGFLGFSTFLIFPVQFLMFAVYVYILYFTGRTYKTAQLQKKLDLGDYIGEVLMIYLYPIGVWFMQPEINKMYFENNKKDNSEI